RQVLRYIIANTGVNPKETCEQLFISKHDIAECKDYLANKNAFLWFPVDYDPTPDMGIATSTAATSTAATSSAPAYTFTKRLSYGSKGPDVTALQNLLITLQYLASGNNSGFFGNLTDAGVEQYQCAKNIVCSGTAGSTGYGAIGPKTLA